MSNRHSSPGINVGSILPLYALAFSVAVTGTTTVTLYESNDNKCEPYKTFKQIHSTNMMQGDDEFATEEMMDDVSLLPVGTAEIPTPREADQQQPHHPAHISSVKVDVVDDNTISSSINVSNNSSSSSIRTNQQSVPTSFSKQTQQSTCRSLRWYQQLNVIHSLMDGSVCYRPTSPDFDSMISIVNHHYDLLQKQYHTLLDLLILPAIADYDDDASATTTMTADAAQQCQLNSNDTNNAAPVFTIDGSAETTARSTITATTAKKEEDEAMQALDPLSAIVLEEDAKINRERMIHENYQREKLSSYRNRTTAKSQLYVPDEPQDPNDPSYIITNANAYMELIRKDLRRLASPHFPNNIVVPEQHQPQQQRQQENRMRQLQSILYIFAISHPNAGYIQGMHEVASFCLYVVEMDAFVASTPTTATNATNASSTDAKSSSIEALAYWLTEQILTSIYVAYDVSTSTISTTEQLQPHHSIPKTNQLSQMSNRILQCFILIDPSLYTVFQHSSTAIPYQLIFTKWIRLLFGREVVATIPTTPTHQQQMTDTSDSSSCHNLTLSHADTVVYLWEVLLNASYRIAQQQRQQQQQYSNAIETTTGTGHLPPIQIVSEYYCAARLWHHKYSIQHLQQYSTAVNNNYLLHWFMNVPPEPIQQIKCIIQRMNYMIDRHSDVNGNRSGGISNLSPFHPIPIEIYAMTPLQQSQSSSTSRSNNAHFWDTASFTGNKGNTLTTNGPKSSFFDSVAAAFTDATSSSSSSSDPIAKALSNFTETIAAKTQSLQKFIVQETTPQQLPPTSKISEQLQQNLNVLQQYVMKQQEMATPQITASLFQQQPLTVPNNVWVALANLQQIQQKLHNDGR